MSLSSPIRSINFFNPYPACLSDPCCSRVAFRTTDLNVHCYADTSGYTDPNANRDNNCYSYPYSNSNTYGDALTYHNTNIRASWPSRRDPIH